MSDRAILKVNNLFVSFTTNDGIIDAVKRLTLPLTPAKPWPLLVSRVQVNQSLPTH